MISIAQRYLVVEILKSAAATTLILFVILISNALGRVLSDVADGKTPADALFPVLLGQSVHIFSLLLPLGLFLGIVFAFGRLYRDHELVVLQACGFGYTGLYRAVLIVLLPILLLSIWCSLFLSAEMQQRARLIIHERENVHEFQQLQVGQFNVSDGGNRVFFMQDLSADRLEVEDVIILLRNDNRDLMETAERGRYRLDDATGDLFLEVGPGVQYLGKAGQRDYQIIEFGRHGILMERKPLAKSRLKSKEKSFTEIQSSKRRADRVEFWWRVAIPVTTLVLALLAVPLSYIAPRQGRYGKIGLALLVFIAYMNLLAVSKSGLEDGQIPMWLNFWWIHALFLLLTWGLLMKRMHRPLLFIRGTSV